MEKREARIVAHFSLRNFPCTRAFPFFPLHTNTIAQLEWMFVRAFVQSETHEMWSFIFLHPNFFLIHPFRIHWSLERSGRRKAAFVSVVKKKNFFLKHIKKKRRVKKQRKKREKREEKVLFRWKNIQIYFCGRKKERKGKKSEC